MTLHRCALIATVLLLASAQPPFAQGTLPSVALPNIAKSGRPTSAGKSQPMPAGAATEPASPANIPAQLLNSTEAAIDQQTRGEFPAMDRGPSLPLGTLQRSWDKPAPASGQTAPGVIHYMWHPDFIMSVRTRDFMVTTLLLPTWERANEFYVGDPVVFEAKRIKPNVVAVRSRNAGADSNLTILGASGNVYNFYLRSETWNSSQVSDLTVYVDAPRPGEGQDGGEPPPGGVTLEGDGEPGSGPGAGTGMPDYLRRIVFHPENLRFDMKMFARRDADADIAPERVFEDGIFTYFDFGDRGDTILRPVVHQLVDGVDTVVNTRTAGPRGNVLVAEAVGDFTLRNGNRVVCVRWLGRSMAPAAVEIGPPPPRSVGAGEGRVGG